MPHKIVPLLFLIPLLIVILGLLLSKQFPALKNITSKNCQKENLQTLLIKDDTFEPPQLTIPKCTRVVFKNIGSKSHWPASDIHPAHGIYPEFDPKKEIAPEREWKFLFDKEGRWRFHDHLFPSLKGVIVVADEPQSLLPKKELPKTNLTDTIEEIAKNEGVSAAWKYLKENSTGVEGTHDIAHFIGSLLFKEKGLNEGLKICDSSFAFGCFHGLIEGLITKEGVENLYQVVASCQKLPQFQGEITCYHGMGHGILSYYNYKLSQALVLCDNLLETKNQGYCYRGVFMENSLVKTQEFSQNDLQWPCDTVDEKYKSACYGYQMVFLARLYGNDVEKITQACAATEKEEYAITCIRGLGQQISQRNNSDPKQIRELCNLAGQEFSSICLIAAAEEFVFQRQSFEIAKQELCNSLSQPWQKECIEKIEVQKKIQ